MSFLPYTPPDSTSLVKSTLASKFNMKRAVGSRCRDNVGGKGHGSKLPSVGQHNKKGNTMTKFSSTLPLLCLLFILTVIPCEVVQVSAFVCKNGRLRLLQQPDVFSSTTLPTTAAAAVVVVESNAVNCDGGLTSAAPVAINTLSMEAMTEMLLTHDAESLGQYDLPVLSVLTSWGRRESLKGAETAEKILNRLDSIDTYDLDGRLKMHTRHYTACIDAWAKSGHVDAGTRADALVHRMDEQGIAMNRVTWNAWMRAHRVSQNVHRVEELLHAMEERIDARTIQIKDYNILLGAYAKQGRALEAERFVKNLVDRYNDGSTLCRPDLCSYSSLMDAWANSNEGGNGDRAEMILDQIEMRCDEWRFDPDPRTYVPAMRAVMRSGEENAMERVLAIKDRAESRGCATNAYMLSSLLDAYATINPKEGLEHADDIISMAEQLEKDGSNNNNTGARTAVYNSALKLYTRCDSGKKALSQAKDLWNKMKSQGTVDAVSISTMITLYGNGGDDSVSSALSVEELLKDMQGFGIRRNDNIQNAAMYAFVQCGMIARATELLEEAEQSYYQNGQLVPNAISYSTIIYAWAKMTDSSKVERAEDLFARMKKMYQSGNRLAEPNFVSYVVLVDTVVKSGQPGSAERAEKILREMYDAYEIGESPVKPNTQLVSSVLDCWQKSGVPNAGERAETLLNWLIDIYERERDEVLMPNEFAFSATISAWAKSRKFGKAARAKAIFDKMVAMHQSGILPSPPNAYCYTAVINSCAYCLNDTLEKRDALQIFVNMYKQMIQADNLQLNDVTFSTVLLALRNLLPAGEKRTTAVKTVFKKITQKGMCNSLVLHRLKGLLDDDVLRQLVGDDAVLEDGGINLAVLPDEWTCNAPKYRRRSSKVATSRNAGHWAAKNTPTK